MEVSENDKILESSAPKDYDSSFQNRSILITNPPISSASNEMPVSSSETEKIIPTSSSDNTHTWKYNSMIFNQNDINDNCKADYLQQLSTNALPPFVPTSPPAFITDDSRLFDLQCCTDCGDSFILKSSLTFHLERRSVLIRFQCDTCQSLKVFYNRCSLLSHIRSHTDKGEKSDIKKAVVTVLPRVFMDGIQSEFVNTLDDELTALDDGDVTPVSELLEFSLHEGENVLEERAIIENTSLIKLKCLDCNEEFDSAKKRIEHLSNGDRIPINVPQCNKCEVLCPSKCSLKAHQRIHLQISPYICPECGESPDPHWSNFLNHVNYKCLHNSRRVGYKCLVCSSIFLNTENLLSHTNQHIEKYYKCNICPRAYSFYKSYEEHHSNVHKSSKQFYTVIYKCCLCDIVVLSSPQMMLHQSTHFKEQVGQYVYSCIHCDVVKENKSQLSEHIIGSHPKIYKEHVLSAPTISKVVPALTSNTGIIECILCYDAFQSFQSYGFHLSKSHIDPNRKCFSCSTVLPNRRRMVYHGKMHLKNESYVCLLCYNKPFSSAEELGVHLNNHVKKLKLACYCPICDDHNLFSMTNILNHLKKEHYIRSLTVYNTQNQSEDMDVTLESRCHFCRESFSSDSELQTHLNKEHKISSDTPSKRQSSESSENPAKKAPSEGNICRKCQFSSLSREEFKQHILSHKAVKSSYQCQECGICFVVQHSLAKHLIISHKISDPDKYMSEEGTNYAPEFDNPTETSTRSALECSVCFTLFQSETALKTHMRSHGMAFIQANKSGLL